MDRFTIANFVDNLVWVYTLLIIAYIVSTLLPLPFNRTVYAIRDFLERTVAPYLNIFRRFIPPFGPIDFSPVVAILVLRIGGKVVSDIIRGA